MKNGLSGAEIRQSFIDYFTQKGHTFVQSSSLVPGGDQTLLFTNAGMVQFKDVFLGTDKRPYTRAVNSQKCMRVAGKHNDLDDVGRDDSHHTMFEMLGNWSFGDYYKKEAITWAWELLTEIWKLDKDKLWTTCFKDEKGAIPADDDAAREWRRQPGINPDHVLYFGRKENFWEMAETGPCGPCSEIHIDQGIEYCDKKGVDGHECHVNGDCRRFLELWNLVFIQYNRTGPESLEPLPATHVDTGMGLERIVAVMQGVDSNYKTDLLSPLMDEVQKLTGDDAKARLEHLTPFRVIADHGRAATFLIADGVIPGNTGRNYICRMIIRRAARFGSKIGLTEPFLARIAEIVIKNYGDAYPELVKNRETILAHLTREEEQFQRTVEAGLNYLLEKIEVLKAGNLKKVGGDEAFDLYATHGLPLEITRDIAQEQGFEVDEPGFQTAMEEHREASGAGKAMGIMGGQEVDYYREIFEALVTEGSLDVEGVAYDPYSGLEIETRLLCMTTDGVRIRTAKPGDRVDVVLPETCFFVESGGQVSDQGSIVSVTEPRWEIRIEDVRRPAAGIIVHSGVVVTGNPREKEPVIAAVESQRRLDIQRNHTATHLLHAELHAVLGGHARQAGSLVAPDRLRFDFTHPEALTHEQLEQIEAGVNQAILENHELKLKVKPLAEAIAEGAMALFGEKYGEVVRTISIGSGESFSYELCGGTHVNQTGNIGLFLIISEGSAAAGVRRIEAVTGREAYKVVQKRFGLLRDTAGLLACSLDEAASKTHSLLVENQNAMKTVAHLRQSLVSLEFNEKMRDIPQIRGVKVLSMQLKEADGDTLRQMTDQFRSKNPSGVVVLGSIHNNQPFIVAAVTDDIVKRGIQANDLVRSLGKVIEGSGGGRPTLAQAGGKNADRLVEALNAAMVYVREHLTD